MSMSSFRSQSDLGLDRLCPSASLGRGGGGRRDGRGGDDACKFRPRLRARQLGNQELTFFSGG